MNEYDSNRILDLTKKINYALTKKIEDADCYVLNTCHIREKATDKVYHEVGRVKKEFRDKKKPIVLITGCVAQAEGERPPYPVTVAVNLSEGKPVGRLLNSLVVSATSRIG